MSENYAVCPKCDGEGDVAPKELSARQRKRLAHSGKAPRRQPCTACAGRGVVPGNSSPAGPPQVAVIGGGLAGCATALALKQRGVACVIFEGDASQNERPQGYALTLQQGSRALRSLGVVVRGTTPNGHASFDSTGRTLGAYAPTQTGQSRSQTRSANVVCPRRRVRDTIASNLDVTYGRRCVSVADGVLTFADGTSSGPFDVIVGADGVRSRVARNKPQYLGYVVALGIAPSEAVPPHLRHQTWQCLDGVANRMYSMPFDGNTDASTDPADDFVSTSDGEPRVMWQYSWRESEDNARLLAKAGGVAIREAVLNKCRDWASYVPHLVSETAPEDVVAYALVDVEEGWCVVDSNTVLIGDAAHAMSPFKGQGANQALVDGVALARRLYRVPALRPIEAPPPVAPLSLKEALLDFEKECIARVTPKLKMSRQNAQLTHSISALAVGDVPRAEAARAALSGAL